jgi:hypothetical protein
MVSKTLRPGSQRARIRYLACQGSHLRRWREGASGAGTWELNSCASQRPSQSKPGDWPRSLTCLTAWFWQLAPTHLASKGAAASPAILAAAQPAHGCRYTLHGETNDPSKRPDCRCGGADRPRHRPAAEQSALQQGIREPRQGRGHGQAQAGPDLRPQREPVLGDLLLPGVREHGERGQRRPGDERASRRRQPPPQTVPARMEGVAAGWPSASAHRCLCPTPPAPPARPALHIGNRSC